jgi:hypothetical protein
VIQIFYMIQDTDLLWTLVVVVMKFGVPYKSHNFLTNCANFGLPRGTPIHRFGLVWV